MSLYNERFLSQEHPNTRYFKNDEIGLTLSRALAETYKAQPGKPIEFFAKFLLNHSRTQKKAQAVSNVPNQIIFLKIDILNCIIGERKRKSSEGLERKAYLLYKSQAC